MTAALTILRNLASAVCLPVFILASLILFIGAALHVISGVAFTVGIIFIILKFVGVLDWSWLWVLAPIWIMAAYFPLMLVSPLVLRHTAPIFGKVAADDPEILWTESHLNWTLVLCYAAAFIAAAALGDIVSLILYLPDVLAGFALIVPSITFWALWLALVALLGIWYLKRKGRSLFHLLWWVPLGAFPLVLPAGFLPGIPVVGLAGVGIMLCLGNKRNVKPSIPYKSEQELSDDANYIVINCGACFRQYKVARGQGIILTRCPNCGREAEIST